MLMYNEKIESLIKVALSDGELTEKEKQILFKRAKADGIDLDEFEMVLDARLVELRKEQRSSSLKSNKLGEVRKCPACGSLVPAVAGACQDCGYEFSGIGAIQSSSLLADKIAKLEEEFSNKIRRDEDNDDDRWQLDKEKNYIIAQTIKSFPIPNTKADLFEFITSMQANMLSPSANKLVSDAYFTKYNEALIKASALFKGDSMLSQFINDKEKVITKYNRVSRKQKASGLKPSTKFLIGLIVVVLFSSLVFWILVALLI